MKKKVIIFLLLALAVGGGYYWYALAHEAKDEGYKFATVEKGDITQTAAANGTLNPVKLVSVGTQVSGTVKRLLVDFNDRVKKGQTLAQLDSELFDAQVSQSGASVKNAQAALDLASANERRARELFSKEYISHQEMDGYEQALKSAKAQLELSKAGLKKDATNQGYAVIKSPVNGIIVDRQIDEGQTVAASFQTPTLFKIAQDLGKMQIDSSFSEADISRIKVGQAARFTVDAFMNRSFEGNVTQVRLNAVTVQNVVTYDVVIGVDNPNELLMPGMTAFVNIVTAEKKEILTIPNAALRYRPAGLASELKKKEQNKAEPNGKKDGKKDGRSATVYVLEDGRPKGVKINIGISDGKVTEALSGELKVGDKLITEESKSASKSSVMPPRMF
jgi:HlyD family secretion protein